MQIIHEMYQSFRYYVLQNVQNKRIFGHNYLTMKGLNPRHDKILDLVYSEDYISVNRLGELMDVSLVTIRKDLSFLEEKGYLYRTHGGASRVERFAFEKSVSEKEQIRIDAKKKIANAAFKIIMSNDFITMASGTTVLFLAREITDEHKLTVLTSSLGVSKELSGLSKVDVIQLGGVLRKSSVSVIGAVAEKMVQQFSSNVLFLGVDGIDLTFGISTSNMEEAELNRLMIQQSDKVVVLADSSKMAKKGFGKIANIEEVDIIITDDEIPEVFKRQLEEKGLEVIIAE